MRYLRLSDPAPTVPAVTDLSDAERAMLALERAWWQRRGSKEQAIADLFGLTPTRYYQLLDQLVDRPEALAHDPMVVNRLRRLREQRARRRGGRQLRAG